MANDLCESTCFGRENRQTKTRGFAKNNSVAFRASRQKKEIGIHIQPAKFFPLSRDVFIQARKNPHTFQRGPRRRGAANDGELRFYSRFPQILQRLECNTAALSFPIDTDKKKRTTTRQEASHNFASRRNIIEICAERHNFDSGRGGAVE